MGLLKGEEPTALRHRALPSLQRERFILEAKASAALTSPSQDDGDKVHTLQNRISMKLEGKAVSGVVSWRSGTYCNPGSQNPALCQPLTLRGEGNDIYDN